MWSALPACYVCASGRARAWLFGRVFFFSNDTATSEIYTLSLHDALPIFPFRLDRQGGERHVAQRRLGAGAAWQRSDRKSTRLNSSHLGISYAVFCLKKKNRV